MSFVASCSAPRNVSFPDFTSVSEMAVPEGCAKVYVPAVAERQLHRPMDDSYIAPS
jgi:hypothetical protein